MEVILPLFRKDKSKIKVKRDTPVGCSSYTAGVFLRFYENSGKIYSKVGFYDKII